MDQTTIHRLNAINRAFYHVTAADFAATRGQAWPGWQQLLPHLRAPLTALDVGCGNGRFGLFLAEKLGAGLAYHGQDNNRALLGYAREALSAQPGLTFTLEERDIVEHPPDEGQYDLVAAFGLLHHIPGSQQRQGFVQALAARLAPGGLLVFACWRFYEYERFRRRIIPWPEGFDVEARDYLLDWRRGQTALRYCHYVDDTEQAALATASGLVLLASWRADGFAGDVNAYSLLRKS